MYYGNCTADYAVEVIREILENVQDERDALGFIHAFLNGELSTNDIADVIDGRGTK